MMSWKLLLLACLFMVILSTLQLLPLVSNNSDSNSALYYDDISSSTANDDAGNTNTILMDAPSVIPRQQQPSDEKGQQQLQQNNRNISNNADSSSSSSWNETLRADETFTGYRYVRNLDWRVPFKVSWSANRDLFEAWKVLPFPPNGTAKEKRVIDRLQYSVVRDPLERLYSGYYNKCIQSPDYEDHCTGFSVQQRKTNPPTLLKFLQRNYRRNTFRSMISNPHYTPISYSIPDLYQMDVVFDMADSDFNRDMAFFWKHLGANHTQVDRRFPVAKNRTLDHYHSGTSSETIQQYFEDCPTLLLAMRATRGDYQGRYAESYFPTPTWALDKLQECRKQGVKLEPPPSTQPRGSGGGVDAKAAVKQVPKQQQQKQRHLTKESNE
jgi:Sulfotransferase family